MCVNCRSKVVSNKKQLGRLVQLMQDNQDLAKGICGRTRGKPRWEAIAVELNSLGPPLRSWEKWLKVWTDLKSKTKKKISENRAEFRATGGGPNSLHILTPLEEGVASFLRYYICSDPPGQEIGHNAIVQSEEIPEEQVACGSDYITISGEDCEMRETQDTEISEVHRTPRRRKVANSTANDRRIALLETQVNNHAKHFEAMEESANNVKKSLKYIESSVRKSYNL
ncbi:uncharacterized protein LOC118745616 isoform X1 [Rhagoletis pomonella]|uniref:uncharacterized protein LOC118745616 isoform X1 n=1 Tax=Rhagoletis pomonella TaxID=28610 RepID=UPI001783B930|nr:uncharacterized protein LOC118745616 isoform X1 [Rhagoletis pomonella]